MSQNVGEIYYSVTADTADLIKQSRVVDRETSKMAGGFTKLAAAVSAALSAIAIEGFVSKVVGAQRQFDVMFASLKTMTGGADQASIAWERLTKFAASTPYSLEQAVKGFTKLKALGLDPSERALTSFGNTASAMGKSLEQMVEAVADASTGEFERLKEFGIKAKQQGDQVSLTFQGVTTKIGNNAAEITEYLTKIGEVQFAGAMSERMKTLDGDISNLQDSLAALYLQISQSGFGDVIARGVRMATQAIQEMTVSIKEGGLTEYFDGLRPYIRAAELAVTALAAVVAGRLVAAFVAAAAQAYASATAIGAATLAARGFAGVLALLGGPIGIAVTGLALLALNWDKVRGSARDAATMSEEAAERIANALRKSPERAAKDLANQLTDVKNEIFDIDKELANKKFPIASEADLKELRERRVTLEKIRSDIEQSMRKLADPDKPKGDGSGPPPPPKPAGESAGAAGKRAAAQAYLEGLLADTKVGLEKIDAEERKALEQNKQRMAQDPANAEIYAQARVEIEKKASQERLDLQLKEAGERYDYLTQAWEKEKALKASQDAERKQGQALAQGIIGDADPIVKLEQELATKSELLLQAYMRDQANEQLYAQARVALEQETAAKIRAIRDQQIAAQQQQQSAQMQAYGQLFDGIAGITQAFAGKQSGIYKAMFAASKAFAIADAIVKIQQGIASAAAMPFPSNIPAMASVAAATGSIVSTIKGTNYGGGRQYGGPVDSGSMYRVGEGNRPEMFVGDSGRSYMIPGERGKVIGNGDLGGQSLAPIVNIYEAPAGATTRSSKDSEGRWIVDVMLTAVAEDMATGGKTARAVQGRFNLGG